MKKDIPACQVMVAYEDYLKEWNEKTTSVHSYHSIKDKEYLYIKKPILSLIFGEKPLSEKEYIRKMEDHDCTTSNHIIDIALEDLESYDQADFKNKGERILLKFHSGIVIDFDNAAYDFITKELNEEV